MSTQAVNHAAMLTDPAFHRYRMFGRTDLARTEQVGRELEPHEAQSRLPWPQLAAIKRIERAVADRSGEVIVARFARQTGKNETEGMLETRALGAWRAIPGSTWVRVAPTWRPQVVNSKLRLEKHLVADPIIAGNWSSREGYIYQAGGAQVQFLSGGAAAQVVGATASIALSVDEAHKIDKGKFEEDFAPFTASTNAPTILWGVAADKQDLLYEYRQLAEGTDRLLEFPAAIWCELSPAYANHYESRRAKLGADHPVILTQYDLVDVEAIGGYLNPAQRAALFAGEHPRLSGPRVDMLYVVVVDIGGQSELDADDEQVRLEEPGRDSTVLWVLELDQRGSRSPYPLVRVVDGHWWTGRDHMESAPEIVDLCKHWNVRAGVIDARGVGEAVAMAVNRKIPAVVPYKATNVNVSEDCYDLLARLNTGRVQFWRADPAADPERREMEAQSRHTRYEIAGHDLMRLLKPSGVGSTDKHIDGMKALTYLHRNYPCAAMDAPTMAEKRTTRRGIDMTTDRF